MHKPLKALLATCLLAAPAAVALRPDPAPPLEVDAQEPEQEPTALQRSMATLKGGQRALKKLIAEPAENRAALMETLGGMEGAALVALRERPPAMGERPEADALWLVGYKRKMATLLQTVLTLEDAVLRADADALAAAYAQLSEIKKAGHGEYRDM